MLRACKKADQKNKGNKHLVFMLGIHASDIDEAYTSGNKLAFTMGLKEHNSAPARQIVEDS